MAKTHFGYVERANESDNNDYWSSTACGLEYTESDMTDRKNKVTCKNCLRAMGKTLNDASALPIPDVSNNEVVVTCATCKWQYAKWEYKCDECNPKYKNWEQDTDC